MASREPLEALRCAKNTDREIWRGKSRAEFGDDDRFYADSLSIPESDIEALTIHCGGLAITKPIREWHALAASAEPASTPVSDLWHSLYTLEEFVAMREAAQPAPQSVEALRARLDEHNRFFSVMHTERIADLEAALDRITPAKEKQ